MKSLKLSGLGAEPKKLALLGLLVVVALYFLVFSGSSSQQSTPGTTPSAALAPQREVAPPPARRQTQRASRGSSSQSLQEFRPSLRPPKEVDRAAIDPTLRIDLLAKLQTVKPEVTRSLFEIGQAPVPVEIAKIKEPAPIKPQFVPMGPPGPPKPAPPPPPPTAPPVPLKFYGWVNPNQTSGPKRAFFLDGEEIIVATEGEVIRKRYKIVRIGLNSAVVEDTQFKSNNQQTLPLVEEQNG